MTIKTLIPHNISVSTSHNLYETSMLKALLQRITFVALITGAIATGSLLAWIESARADSHIDSIEQGCDRESGTFHDLGTGAWICFYGEPLVQSESLGIYHTQSNEAYRLVLQETADGNPKLAMERIVYRQSTDD